jgi:hypothetical protein
MDLTLKLDPKSILSKIERPPSAEPCSHDPQSDILEPMRWNALIDVALPTWIVSLREAELPN